MFPCPAPSCCRCRPTLFTARDDRLCRTADGAFFAGNGFVLAYDFQPYFVRLAHDPRVNFTNNDMKRISFGKRFRLQRAVTDWAGACRGCG